MALSSATSDLSVDLDRLALDFARIAVKAGAAIMDIYQAGAEFRFKADSSPVCDADERAEALILADLARLAPDIPVLAEEAAAKGDKPEVDGRFILVDPLDGTKEFMGRNGEFTVNIALIEAGAPTAGAVYAPALQRLWFAGARAYMCGVAPGAAVPERLDVIATREPPGAGLIAMASRSHTDAATEAFLRPMPVAERRSAGSSLKFCSLAEGQADVYPRFGPTMEWDTAAGDAVLRAAGGIVLDLRGQPLRYGKAALDFRNSGFVAWGRPAEGRRWMQAAAAATATGSSLTGG